MTRRDLPESLTPDEARARDAVRGLGVPAAEPSFRARLKRDFVAGKIGEARVLSLPATAATPAPWYRRPAFRLALVPAALAGLVVGGFAMLSMTDRGPGWTLMTARGSGAVMVDGAPV